jgi:hypothetical protein
VHTNDTKKQMAMNPVMGMDDEQLVHILVAHDSESDAALFPVHSCPESLCE